MKLIAIGISLSFIVSSGHVTAQLAEGKCKFLGNIIAGSTPGDFITYWNQVTPENAGKWYSVEPTRDAMNWTQLDNAYNTAKENGLPFKQHTFVWGQQAPSWIGDLSQEEQKAEVEEWISEYCSRYPDTDYIDVVNEPLHAPAAYRNALGGNGVTGWDWIVWAFETTRQYCPNAKLFLNDYNILSANTSTDAYIRIIEVLKEKNLIDGIGEQGHFMETTSIETIRENLNRLASFGLPIHISEFDLNIASDTEQKERYEELFPVFWNHYAVEGVTLWGYKQGQIWREDAYLIKSSGVERPALTWLKDYVASSSGGNICVPLSTEEDNLTINAYPNPLNSDQFSIEVGQEGYSVTIYNQQGDLVRQQTPLAKGVNTIHFQRAAGLYVLKYSDASQRHTYTKLVKY